MWLKVLSHKMQLIESLYLDGNYLYAPPPPTERAGYTINRWQVTKSYYTPISHIMSLQLLYLPITSIFISHLMHNRYGLVRIALLNVPFQQLLSSYQEMSTIRLEECPTPSVSNYVNLWLLTNQSAPQRVWAHCWYIELSSEWIEKPPSYSLDYSYVPSLRETLTLTQSWYDYACWIWLLVKQSDGYID